MRRRIPRGTKYGERIREGRKEENQYKSDERRRKNDRRTKGRESITLERKR